MEYYYNFIKNNHNKDYHDVVYCSSKKEAKELCNRLLLILSQSVEMVKVRATIINFKDYKIVSEYGATLVFKIK